MSKKRVKPTIPDFDYRMKGIRPIILNAASKYLKQIQEIFSYVPIVDLAAIELAKVESISKETETCVFVTVDEQLFFEVFFYPDETVIQVDQLTGAILSEFFNEVVKKTDANINVKNQDSEDISIFDNTFSKVEPDIPTEMSKNVKSCGKIFSSTLKVIDHNLPSV